MKTVIGIDEVGRGAWAGPLLIVAARQRLELPKGIKDSKLLSPVQRQHLLPEIMVACDIGEGWVQPAEIDRIGLSKAMYLGVARALEALGALEDEQIIMDGGINFVDPKYYKATAVVGGDKMFPVVSAASIVAKVARDKYMSELPGRYASWEFERHVGYGTERHSTLLKRHGICDIHRRSFKPIKLYVS